jgi:hypothetical protein
MPAKIKNTCTWLKNNWQHLALGLFLVCLLIWGLVKIDRPAYSQPEGGERLSFTPFNDYLILMAGDRFAEEGFARHYFLSNMTVGYPEFSRGWYAYQTELPEVRNASIYYTHYGPFDAIVVGIWEKLGVGGLPVLYKIAAFFSVFSLLLWYLTALRLFGRGISLVSTVVMGSSLVFLRFFDNISVYVYDIFFAFSAAFLFVLAESRPGATGWKRYIPYAGAWLMFALLSVNSPEFIPWAGVFGLGYLWARHGRKVLQRWRTAVLIIAAPVVGQVGHFIQVAAALGGVRNAFIDYTSALMRRTTGFQLAEEIDYRGFTIWEALRKIEADLWNNMRFEIGILLALLAVSGWLAWRLRRQNQEATASGLWSQWWLLLVFFIAGGSFWVLMLQSTVTQAGSAYRPVLPFFGLALGYCVVNIYHYFRLNTEKLAVRVLVLLVVVIIIVPTLQDRLSGRPFRFSEHDQRLDMYYGVYPAEIKALGGFIGENTEYGDIVLTNFRVAETGHPRYPFPGYEYESGRRVEYTRDTGQAVTAIKELADIRAGLSADNPASRVALYVLVDDGGIGRDYGRWAQSIGGTAVTFYEADYWTGLYGTIPVPYGDTASFAPRSFYLFRVDDIKFKNYLATFHGETSG